MDLHFLGNKKETMIQIKNPRRQKAHIAMQNFEINRMNSFWVILDNMFENHDFDNNTFEYITSDVYIDIFANFGPKFSGNIHDISNTENKGEKIFFFWHISVYAPSYQKMFKK